MCFFLSKGIVLTGNYLGRGLLGIFTSKCNTSTNLRIQQERTNRKQTVTFDTRWRGL